MRLKRICLIISVILILLCSLMGCKPNDPIEDFYGTYQLTQLKYSYYDNGINRSGWKSFPIDSPYFGSTEQNEFYNEMLSKLGEELSFTKDYIRFSGTYNENIPYEYDTVASDGSFRFSFDNIIGAQNDQIRKYIAGGSTSVWKDCANQTIESRTIRIACTLYVKERGELDFKPVAVFEFEYFSNNN